jgi:L-rhamnose mutarotase
MDAAEVNTRWQEAMGRFFVDSGPDEAMDRLDEAFHLETQLANADTNQKEK